MKDKGLTPNQQRFVEEYLIDLNATQAAIRAGYSAKTANEQAARLLAKVSIQSAVSDAKAKRSEKTEITAEWVVEQLVTNYTRAMQAEPVLDRDGIETGEYRYEGSVANKALELLGKHIGMFGDKLTLAGDRSNPVQVNVANVLQHPEFLDYLRDRVVRKTGNAGPVCNGREQRALENGPASHPPRPGTNGHAH